MSSAAVCSLECVPDRPSVVSFDVSAVTDVDESVLEDLARLLLTARRLGVTVELRNANRPLIDLLTLAGFTDALCVEVSGKAEEREEVGVDKEVDAGDEAV